MTLHDQFADAIDTARRNDDDVHLPVELAQEIAARLAPAAVGGVDLERWRALIAEYDAGPKHWPDEEQPCTIDLAQARAVVVGLERLARYEGAAQALLDLYRDDPEYAEEWPALHHLPRRDGREEADATAAGEVTT